MVVGTMRWPKASLPRSSASWLTIRIGNTRDEARTAVFEYIQVWYNRERRHSTLDYLSSLDQEQQLLTKETFIQAA